MNDHHLFSGDREWPELGLRSGQRALFYRKVDEPKDKRVILQNRRARHEYAISDTEAGLVLVGTEVKVSELGTGI